MDITIRVLDQDDEAVAGAKVDVKVEGSMLDKGPGGYLDTAYTDDSGDASFTTKCEYPDDTEIEISVNDESPETQEIGDGELTVHIES